MWLSSPLTETGPAIGRGTTVYAVPDGAIFGNAVPTRIVHVRLRELAVLYPNLSFSWNSRRVPSFGGLAGFARRLARHKANGPHLVADQVVGESRIELAVAWGDGPAVTRGYVNQLGCTGSHIDGLLEGLAGTEERGRAALVAVTTPVASFLGRDKRVFDDQTINLAVRRVVEKARTECPSPIA